jgi:uncharacterized protein YndB with AHSA1/START domain
MRRILASTILVAAVFAQSVSSAAAQDVRNTSYVTKSGERVLRIETVVPATTESVWKAWTDPQELSKWIAPVVAIDLKIGGKISTNYDQKATIGNQGTIQLPIINYVEEQLITLKVNLTDKFPKKVRDEDRNLQEIVQIVDLGGGKTEVVSSMVGWGTRRMTFSLAVTSGPTDNLRRIFHRRLLWSCRRPRPPSIQLVNRSLRLLRNYNELTTKATERL